MSDRHRSVLVGAFAVGALIIAAAGTLFVAGGGLGTTRQRVAMVFEGSLRGLNVGAPVALRGVTIGQVTGIQLRLDPRAGDLTMLVEADIEPSRVQLVDPGDVDVGGLLVERGLRAQLGMQSLLTGLLYVQLDFYPEREARVADIDLPYPQIPTIPTELEVLRASLETVDLASIAGNVDRIARGLDQLLSNSDMQALPATLKNTLIAVEQATGDLSATLSANGPRVASLLEASGQVVAGLNRELPLLLGSMEGSLERLRSALEATEAGMAGLEHAMQPDSSTRQQMIAALQELTLAARAMRSLARSIDEHPESLLRGRRVGETP